MNQLNLSRNKYFFICLILLQSIHLNAQNWQQVGDGFNSSVNSVISTEDGDLIFLGGFNKSGEQDLCGVAQLEGGQLIPLTTQEFDAGWTGGLSQPVLFGEHLYFIGGSFDPIEGQSLNTFPQAIINFDGEQFLDTDFDINIPTALGAFDEVIYIGSPQTSDGLATFYSWDGVTLDSISATGFIEDSQAIAQILCFQWYEDELYVGGNINIESQQINEVFRWNGDTIDNLDGGIPNLGGGNVIDFEEYDGMLAIGGNFSQAEGNPSGGVLFYNGLEFLAAGSVGMNGRVNSLLSYGGYLYAAGYFTEIDGMSCRIGRWNGEAWECFSNDVFTFGSDEANGVINQLLIHEGELFIIGGFDNIAQSPMNYVAKYVGMSDLALNTPGISIENDIKIHYSMGSIQFSGAFEMVQNHLFIVYDPQGKQILSEWINGATMNVPTWLLASGCYVYSIIDDRGNRISNGLLSVH